MYRPTFPAGSTDTVTHQRHKRKANPKRKRLSKQTSCITNILLANRRRASGLCSGHFQLARPFRVAGYVLQRLRRLVREAVRIKIVRVREIMRQCESQTVQNAPHTEACSLQGFPSRASLYVPGLCGHRLQARGITECLERNPCRPEVAEKKRPPDRRVKLQSCS